MPLEKLIRRWCIFGIHWFRHHLTVGSDPALEHAR